MTDFMLFQIYGLLLCTLVVTLVWWRQLYTQNASIIDGWWSLNFGLLVTLYFLLSPSPDLYDYAILFAVVLWSFRLGFHLLVRNMAHEKEDIRYQKLREEYGDQQAFKMWRFFFYQAVSNVALAFPFALMLTGERENSVWLQVGLFIWLIALIGESLADSQLKRFKSKPENKGQVCETGLWKYSRHPNYFFEWLIWVGYFVMALSVSWGWTAILCPLLMYHLLRNVTGIPMLEELSTKSKGDAYRKYQQTTSAFFPWFKKERD